MPYLLLWAALAAAFISSLLHDSYAPNGALKARNPFSDAHHFWYASVVYWMVVALVPNGWAKVALLTVSALAMLDDAVEHFTRGKVALGKNLYGKLGGKW